LGQTPLFNVAFGVQNAPNRELRLNGLKITSATAAQEEVRFDLTLWIADGAEMMRAGWTYSTDLFEEETIVRMHGHYETLLSSIVARPDAPLDELVMLSEAERSRQSINRSRREADSYSMFKSVKPKTIPLSES